MKYSKQIFIINTFLIMLLLFCSFSKNKITSVSGYVHVYGNEPFTYIGIKTSDDKEYSISSDDQTKADLWESQGKLIEITGYIEKNEKDQVLIENLKDGRIVVTEWKYLK